MFSISPAAQNLSTEHLDTGRVPFGLLPLEEAIRVIFLLVYLGSGFPAKYGFPNVLSDTLAFFCNCIGIGGTV